MKSVSWGFIGCGEVTERKSGPAFSLVEGSHVEAVMSRNRDKVRQYAERHNIKKWYTDAQELIEDERVTAVYVATPPSSHATYAIMAMRAGKPVYVEKPLAASYEDCARINRVSQETGVPCFVAYYRRYLPYFQHIKSLIYSGAIGKILSVNLRFSVPPRALDTENGGELPWRLQPDISGGGYFYDLAPHQLDLLQDIFGIIVKAHGYHANRAHRYAAEDTVSACFQFQDGLVGTGLWNFVAAPDTQEDVIEVTGNKGLLRFSVYNYTPICLITDSGQQEITLENPDYVQLPIIQSVIEDLRGIATCEATAISATPTNWVMDRILGKL